MSSADATGSGTRFTGIGSWPGTGVAEAVAAVRDLLAQPGGGGLPYLPELPARGPGADLVGRGAGLLVDLPVDLQPSGWRLTQRPGRDAARTAALLREDLDELAAAYDGWTGALKVQVAGPWTLAAGLQTSHGAPVLADAGAVRDLVASLAEGVRRHLADLSRLVPGAGLTLQVDEPSLPTVLGGALPTASGLGRVHSIDPSVVRRGLSDVLAAHDGGTVVHCCHPEVPLSLLSESGAAAVAVDLTSATPARWESVAAAVESGTALYAGCLPCDDTGTREGAVRLVADGFRLAGLPDAALGDVTLTPACGLAGLERTRALAVHRTLRDVAAELTERSLR